MIINIIYLRQILGYKELLDFIEYLREKSLADGILLQVELQHSTSSKFKGLLECMYLFIII